MSSFHRSTLTIAKITPNILGPRGLFNDMAVHQILGLPSIPQSLYEFFLAGKQPDVLALADLFGKLGIPKKNRKRKTMKPEDMQRIALGRRGRKTAAKAQGHMGQGKRGGRVQKGILAGCARMKRGGRRKSDDKMEIGARELDMLMWDPVKIEMKREAKDQDDVIIKTEVGMYMDLDQCGNFPVDVLRSRRGARQTGWTM